MFNKNIHRIYKGDKLPNINKISEVILEIGDLVLQRSFKKQEYMSVILPFTLLKRLDNVLKYSKSEIIETYKANKDRIDSIDSLLYQKAIDETGQKLGYYNYSVFDFNKLLQDPDNIEENLMIYINSFSNNIKNILENFNIERIITKLSKTNTLYILIKKFNNSSLDLSIKNISNYKMGQIFDDLIYSLSKTASYISGEHSTPKDVVNLMTELLLIDVKQNSNDVKWVYDPTCGVGGTLTSCNEFFTKNNIEGKFYGQEINREILAISQSSMLLRGKNPEHIKGPSSTLSDDQFPNYKFDYIISNPPFGYDWKNESSNIESEVKLGFNGRFKAGLSSRSDGTLLFIQHMISKMKSNDKSRVVILTNYSPLYKGDIGSGESNIRKWIIENDYLETIIALPKNLFFNTSIDTYIWILTNQKEEKRKGKLQLINAVNEFVELKSPIHCKKNNLNKKSILRIVEYYKQFKNNENVRIIDREELGYQRIIIEKPMQLNFQVSENRLKNLYSYRQFKKLAESNSNDLEIKEKEEKEGKEKQKRIIDSLKTIPDKLYTNWNIFEKDVINVLEPFQLKPNFIKNIILKLSEHDGTADYVLDKKGNIKMDPNLTEVKKLPININIQEYFEENILIHNPNAKVNFNKLKIGYEINFKHLIYDDNIFFGDIDYPIHYFEDFVRLKHIINADIEDNDLIFKILPRHDKMIFYPNELSSAQLKKNIILIGCKIISDKILKEYLYYYFNSNKGLKSISYFQQGNFISIRDLIYLRIPVPDIETQKNIVETCRLVDGLFNEMEIWKTEFSNNILNYEPALESYKDFSCTIKFGDDGGVSDFCRNWRIVYQGLIWPLAYTYLKATKGSKDESIMKHNHLVLFEFLAAFNVIILISGITDSEITPEQLKTINIILWELHNENEKTWHMMHFGGWTTLYSRLSKIYKDEKYEFVPPINQEFFQKLSVKRYSKLFNKLRFKERNPEAHGGFEDHIDVETKLDDLKVYIDTDIFNILNIYAGYKLYYITEEIKKIAPKKLSHKVMSLNGPCDPPNWHDLVLDKELDPYALYLYDPLTNSYLKINSNLMKFKQISNSKQYGIYLYDGIDTRKKVAKYKCYHQKNEIWEISYDNEEETYHDLTKDFLKIVLKLNCD